MIIIKGNPISVNGLYQGRRFLTKKGKDIKESYCWEIKSQWKKPTMKGRIIAEIWAYFGSKRGRDLDNIAKAMMDSFTGIAYEDDSQIDELHIYRNYDKLNPRVEVELTEINYEPDMQ